VGAAGERCFPRLRYSGGVRSRQTGRCAGRVLDLVLHER
jgi:hypothetical protein